MQPIRPHRRESSSALKGTVPNQLTAELVEVEGDKDHLSELLVVILSGDGE